MGTHIELIYQIHLGKDGKRRNPALMPCVLVAKYILEIKLNDVFISIKIFIWHKSVMGWEGIGRESG